MSDASKLWLLWSVHFANVLVILAPNTHLRIARRHRTSIIGNVSLAWLRKVANGPAPFLAYIAPKVPTHKTLTLPR